MGACSVAWELSSRRAGAGIRCQRETEDRQLEAEALAVGGIEVAGEIPPLLAVLRMRTLIAGKLQWQRCEGLCVTGRGGIRGSGVPASAQ